MRTGRRIAFALGSVVALAAPGASGQPNLPPPPPPPLGQPTDLPPPSPRTPTAAPPPRAYEPPAPPPSRAPPRRRRETVYVYEEPPRPVAITLNPLALTLTRLGANVEVLLAPHHALIVSPSFLLFNDNRGNSLITDALGFASQTSRGFGVEVGYHYWWRWRQSLSGPFFGPSLLLGSTTNAYVGDTASAQAYYGVAFDVGMQEVLPGGFTLGGGLGLGFVHMASATAGFPRVLVQIGWSF